MGDSEGFSGEVWEINYSGLDPCDVISSLRFFIAPDTMLALVDPCAEQDELPFTGLTDFIPSEPPGSVRIAQRVLYLTLSDKVLAQCHRFLDCHATIELATHVLVFRNGRVAAAMYDFGNDPLTVAEWVPEETVALIAAALNRKYKKTEW